MMALRVLLFTIEVICCLLLIGIILIQKSKGGGLGLAFGGGGTESLFGSRAGNVLTKATIFLAIIFMVNTVALAILFARGHDATLMDRHREPVAASAQPASMPTLPEGPANGDTAPMEEPTVPATDPGATAFPAEDDPAHLLDVEPVPAPVEE